MRTIVFAFALLSSAVAYSADGQGRFQFIQDNGSYLLDTQTGTLWKRTCGLDASGNCAQVFWTREQVEGQNISENIIASKMMDLRLRRASASENVSANGQSEVLNDYHGYFGFLLGDVSTFGSDKTNNFTFTGRAGVDLGQIDGSAVATLGFYVGRINSSTTVSGISVKSGYTALLSDISARNLFGSGLYFGARTGLTLLSAEITGNGTTLNGNANSFTVGPVFGYDFKFRKKWSVIMDAAYLYLGSGSASVLGTAVNYSSTKAMAVQAGISYNF